MPQRKKITRKEFLKGAAAKGAGLLAGGVLVSCDPSEGGAPQRWDRTTDVIVIGFGGAGACAAAVAGNAGAEVLVLEKREEAGGSTAVSGGAVYAANTSVQKANGIQDSAEKMYQHYLNTGKGLNNPELARIASNQSADNIEWLIELGGKFPRPPALAGQEVNVGSEPIARVHSVTYQNLPGGAAFFQVMADAAYAKGARVLLETEGKQLVVHDQGEVIGVKAKNSNKEMFIKARLAVILTTGGFTRNKEMLAAYSRQGYYSDPLGVPDLTGDGLRMGLALGADVVNMSEILGVPGLTLPGAERASYAFWSFSTDLHGIFVNIEGKRFVDEFTFYDWKNTELLAQPEARCYSVFDDNLRKTGKGRIVAGFSDDLEKEVTSGVVLKADTIKALAEKMKIPGNVLQETIAKWNTDAKTGADTDFDRKVALGPIETPPFYAFETYSTMFDTAGGLKINAKAQVVDVWGNVIPRLYAAGSTSGGVIGEHYPGSGTALNALLTFGRIAGKNAAAEKPL
jgi:flavocytochrome c